MKPIEYRGSLTREQFMFYETRIVAKKIQEGKSEEETVKEIVADNLFQFPTEKNYKIHRYMLLQKAAISR